MNKILIIFFLFLATLSYSQTNAGSYIPDSLKVEQRLNKTSGTNQIQASCASPNGTMSVIAAPPPSYAWLQANGYCHPASYGSSGTICWSFVPTQNSVTINSGYSSTGCGIIGFGPFTLYACSPSCTVVGTGLSFAVSPGQCYTWCMGFNGTGGLCSFNDFCPYFQQTLVLPIELLYFAGSNQGQRNVIQWSTATESRNNYFAIENSQDAISWSEVGRINGAGNSQSTLDYSFIIDRFSKSINYYRLKQVDYDGAYKYHGIIAIDNSSNADLKVIKRLNIIGQEVDEQYQGIMIIYYDNGMIEKQMSH